MRYRTAHRVRLRADELERRDVPAAAFALGTGANANNLFRFDTATPGTIAATTPITGLLAGDVVVGTDFRPATGGFYGVAANTGADTVQVYLINPFTGAAAAVGTAQTVDNITGAASWGVDFNPAADRIRVVNDLPSDGGAAGSNANNFRLNPDTGVLVAIDPDLDFTGPALPGGNSNAPETAVAYINSNTGTQPGGTTQLFGIVTGGDRLVTNGGAAPGFATLSNVGLLGVDTSANAGLDIFGPDNTAVALLTPAAGPGLYSVDLTSGAATLIGAIGNGTLALADVSVAPVLAPVVVGGSLDGSVKLITPVAGQGSVTATVSVFSGATVDVRATTGDVNGDNIPDIIAVTGPGTAIRLTVISGADNSTVLVAPFDPFGGGFTGGGFVAAGDFDANGRAEVVVTPDRGGGPRVTIFSLVGTTFTQVANYFTLDPGFLGGIRPAVGRVNTDAAPDLVIAAGFGGGPRVAVIDGTKATSTDGFAAADRLVNDFFVFDPVLRNGAYVAVGDANNDGFGDLAFGAGPGGAPRVLVISGQTLLTAGAVAAVADPLANFFVAGNIADRGGVRVASVDLDGDRLADLAVGSGENSVSNVRVYRGVDFTGTTEPTVFQDFDPFGGAVLADGVFVG